MLGKGQEGYLGEEIHLYKVPKQKIKRLKPVSVEIFLTNPLFSSCFLSEEVERKKTMKVKKLFGVFLAALLLPIESVTHSFGMLPEPIINEMLMPWCHKTGKTILQIEEKIIDKKEGAYTLMVEIGGISNESFDKKNHVASFKIKAKALLGLLCLADQHLDTPGIRNVLRKGVSIFEYRTAIKDQLSEEEKECLAEISSDSEESSSAMEIEPELSDY
ncbi:MAG: hypothetical protein LBR62_01035 [Puniceicoccales bacterium]|jgi:hypothetical protein|nr:hypothetical protein [Puniceicoccales bacterium]